VKVLGSLLHCEGVTYVTECSDLSETFFVQRVVTSAKCPSDGLHVWHIDETKNALRQLDKSRTLTVKS